MTAVRQLLLALPLLLGPLDAQAQDRRVALTFDDLPMTGVDGRCDPDLSWSVTDLLLAELARRGAEATGFVNAGRMCGRPPEELRDPLLERWLDAGHELGNHTWSHPDINQTPLAAYLEDVRRGAVPVDSLLRLRGKSLTWFRHPQLHAGATEAKKRGLAEFLESRGERVAPVTVDNQEWVYAYVYHAAQERGDRLLGRRVAAAYLDHIDQAFAYFEARSVEVLGREIPQVLLLHANRLNAELARSLLDRIAARGYRFVPLAEVMADPVYDRADPYLGRSGPSWIERWAVAEGGEAGAGPREATWVADAYERLRAAR